MERPHAMIGDAFTIDDAVSTVMNDSADVPVFQSMLSPITETTLTFELLIDEILTSLESPLADGIRIMDEGGGGDGGPGDNGGDSEDRDSNQREAPAPPAEDSPDVVSGDVVVELSADGLSNATKHSAASLSSTPSSTSSDGGSLGDSVSPNDGGARSSTPEQREQQSASNVTPGTQEGTTPALFQPAPSALTATVSSTAGPKSFTSTTTATRDDVTAVQGLAAWSEIGDHLGDLNTIADYAHEAGGSFKMPREMKVLEWSLKVAGQIKGTDEPVSEFAVDVTRMIATGWIAGVAGEAMYSTALAAAGATAGAPLAVGAAAVVGAALLGYYGGKIVEQAVEATPPLLHQHVTPIVSDAVGNAQDAMTEFAVYIDAQITGLYPTNYPQR
ncbi:hypothetical protein HFO39_14165 [Rhizobium leguminosarum]|uniref:hypothetical protein n=1 Tax=Rhizobium leguminosarum TaxID=384 RepID=UPI001C9803DA|nr:hypothetical protein [Rhizobium leguminosarum]MBY5635914.1 hypothetical protein [Rhizobium leguminosarum]